VDHGGLCPYCPKEKWLLLVFLEPGKLPGGSVEEVALEVTRTAHGVDTGQSLREGTDVVSSSWG
jgi:hypothetical protein